MTEHRIIQGEVLAGLATLPDNSVQCTVTSPPYDQARTYDQKSLKWDFLKVAKELYRVTCPGGVVCWNVNDMMINGSESLTHARQGIYFVDECGFNLDDPMQKLAFTFFSEIGELSHKADVILEENGSK